MTDEQEEDAASRLIQTIDETEHSTLEAVRKFVDTVDGAFPDLDEDGPRRKIIDSAFKMVEQLVGASNELAQNIVDVAGNVLETADRGDDSSEK
jgi:hypothetical protein